MDNFVKESDFQITVPSFNKYFYISDKDKMLFDYIYSISQFGANANVMLIGPHGCGKSESVKQYAASKNLKFFETNCSLYREPRDFFGIKNANQGNTYVKTTQILKAFQTENCVILLDELNRCVPSVVNGLYGLLDDRRSVYFDEVGLINVAKGVTVFATRNVGLRYTGTMPSDISLLDRFNITLEVDFLPPEQEIKVLMKRTGIHADSAELLVKFASTVRDKAAGLNSSLRNTISTRALINCADMYTALGMQALDYTIMPLYSEDGGNDSERSQVKLIRDIVFGQQ